MLRPLFATAWLIANFMQRADDFGAGTMLLSSASSKTAYATAFCLKRRPAPTCIVGATSPSRHAFAAGLGVSDHVIDYGPLACCRPTSPRSASLTIESRRGVEALRSAYLETLQGRADASRGLMLSF